MRKLRLYFETTVFNYFFDTERPGHVDAVKLFEAVSVGRFEGYTSRYVTQELERAPEPKRSKMLALIDTYGLKRLDSTPKAERLGRLYIARGIIPSSHVVDSVHVAAASVYELDFIVSYNFHHINRNKTKMLCAVVNKEEGYGEVIIATAEEVLNYAGDLEHD